jgi:hypothetical protein
MYKQTADNDFLHFVRLLFLYLLLSVAVLFFGLGLFFWAAILRSTGGRARDQFLLLIPGVGFYVGTRALWRYSAKNHYWEDRSDLNPHPFFGPGLTLADRYPGNSGPVSTLADRLPAKKPSNSVHRSGSPQSPKRGSNMEGRTLLNGEFATLDLSNANFDNSVLGKADFKLAILINATFRGAAANGASFWGGDLEGADFTGARLRHANFSEAILENVDFSEADLFGASFQRASWSEETKWPKHFAIPEHLMARSPIVKVQSGSSPQVPDDRSLDEEPSSLASPSLPSQHFETDNNADRSDSDLAAQLNQLASLYESGHLTDQEFSIAKGKILDP